MPAGRLIVGPNLNQVPDGIFSGASATKAKPPTPSYRNSPDTAPRPEPTQRSSTMTTSHARGGSKGEFSRPASQPDERAGGQDRANSGAFPVWPSKGAPTQKIPDELACQKTAMPWLTNSVIDTVRIQNISNIFVCCITLVSPARAAWRSLCASTRCDKRPCLVQTLVM